MSSKQPREKMILVTSGYGANTNQPFVQVEAEELDRPLQMSPNEARALAVNLLEAADAAETDGYLVGFFRDELKQDRQGIAVILSNFRKYRRQRAKIDKGTNRFME